MAEKRMFSKAITDSDEFLDMSLTAQALYFHLGMAADDDGFVNNPRKIRRMVGAQDDDLKLLIAKHFLIPFESGIVVIKHWRINNYIRNDRYKPTAYQDEMKQLFIKENGSYTLDGEKVGIPHRAKCLPHGIPSDYQAVYQDKKLSTGDNETVNHAACVDSNGSSSGIPGGIPMVDQRYTQYSIDKSRLDKSSLDKNRVVPDGGPGGNQEGFVPGETERERLDEMRKKRDQVHLEWLREQEKKE